MKNVLLVKTGEAAVAVRQAVGDYDTWFARVVAGRPYRLHVVRPYLGEPLPRRARDWEAVWTTGSSASLTLPEPWMEPTARWLREAGEGGVPVLGVCFGHQLLASAFGARVVRSPLGREVGPVQVALTPAGRADPLFHGLPDAPLFHATHEDEVEGLPPGVQVLAGNAHCAVQALAVGPHIRAVQFHPEVEADAMGALLAARAAQLEAAWAARGEAPGRLERLRATLRPLPTGRQLLLNFLAHWT